MSLLLARIARNHRASAGGDPYWSSVSALLHFDEADGSNTFADQKGGVWVAHGDAHTQGGGLLLDGSGDFVNSDDASGSAFADFASGDYTVECFVTPLISQTYAEIATKRSAANVNAAFYLRFESLHLHGGVSNGSTWLEAPLASTPAALGEKIHVALARSSTVFRVFQAGLLVASKTIPASLAFNTNTLASPISVGATSDGTEALNGRIGGFRITRGVARYTGNFTPPTFFPNS